jgi:hypothetical protein
MAGAPFFFCFQSVPVFFRNRPSPLSLPEADQNPYNKGYGEC